MDVQCERCKTEYEFDDALVSGRGTTVKCTNCGHQFKVRPTAEVSANERWVVRTAAGHEIVFTSLRELQRAITSHEVGRADTLSRGNAPPRSLGAIAELEPFFLARPARGDGLPPPPEPQRSRMPTLRPPSAAAVPPSTPPARLAPISQDPRSHAYAEAGTMMAPAVPQIASSSVSRPPPHPSPLHVGTPAGSARGHTERLPSVPATPPVRVMTPPTVPIRRAEPDEESEPLDGRHSLSDRESQYMSPPRRRRRSGWIVGSILLAAVLAVGYRLGEPLLANATKTTTHKALDSRAEQFLTEGESAFHEGNLELAKEKFDKASALAESDPRVLLDVARLAAARADVPWLKTRLLPESADDELRAAKQQLIDLGAAARRSADAAALAAPDDVPAVRAHVDALRIVGERDAARGYVGKIIANVAQPETSYVLAALDLAEIDPIWTTIIDRLRVAAAGEGNSGRARAALVYALARSGDAPGAKTELDRLAALPSGNPLVSPLRAFLARTTVAKAPPQASASASAGRPAAVDVDSLPRSGGSSAPEPGGGGGGGGDPREILREASAAENRGQFPRATKLYEDAMHADPNNSEALAGLGSVSLKTGDFASARAYFGRALAINPNYVPALVGQADAMWSEGDKPGAVKRYKDIVERFPESSGFPSYVKTRAEGSASGSNPTSPQTPTAPTPAPAGSVLTLPANIPSDLPGAPP